ncbi:hypothetical protein [Castellaniella sp. UC4442_H9]
MPGKRITDHQMTQYKKLRVTHGQETSAAKVGISVASARRLEGRDRPPSQRTERHWRTRADPLSEVWVSEIVPMLQAEPDLMTVTILEELQPRHPGRLGDSKLRTLQRPLSRTEVALLRIFVSPCLPFRRAYASLPDR